MWQWLSLRALQMLFRWLPAVLAGEEWAAAASLFWVGSLSFLSGGFKIFYLNSVSGSPRCGLFFFSLSYWRHPAVILWTEHLALGFWRMFCFYTWPLPIIRILFLGNSYQGFDLTSYYDTISD